MSNLLRKRRPTTGGAEISPSSWKIQRLADTTEMLLDIAKESADVFPPLKSCLGGISALIKHYQESKDVEEKLGDLIPWLSKLKNDMTTPSVDDNREQDERREQLTRSLEDIEKRSRILSDKGKMAKVLDKKRDSGMVTKLVEELRQAILVYQLSQQRSIDNQVAQLVSSFNKFLKFQEKTSGIKEKIESALARLGRLTVGGSTPGDEDESKRKLILFEALEGIKDELRPILERSSAVGYKENDADVYSVCELAEDVRDSVMEYQFAQQTIIYEQNCSLIDSADLLVLNNCRRTKGAEYRHGNRRGCLKGTRDTVLSEIESWAKDFTTSPVFWLNGLAGTGKSTIAQTIAERLFSEGNLGASFFCSRDFEDRSNLHLIFPTLAFQLAYKYPNYRSRLVSLLRSNPDVGHESMHSQMQKMIAEPLRKAGISTVIVIDALDECKDDEPSSAILSILGRFVEQLSEVKFFITGRPEPRIRSGFRLPLLVDSTDVFVLHDVHPSLIEKDIRLFLKHELSELGQRRKLEGWPSDEKIDLLCGRAAGLFVYAVATVRFLDSNNHLPNRRLDVIWKLPGSTAPEGRTRFNPNTTLDSLYTSILQAAFIEGDADVDSKVRTIVGTVVMLVNPLSPLAIAELLGQEPDEVVLYLELIQSLLAIGEDSDQPIKPFHKSFPDFIVDPSRCTDTRFYVSPGSLHSELATNCLRLMNSELEQNLLSLPDYALNSEIQDLQTRINSRISIALQYACRSWHSHLAEAKGEIADIIPYLQVFLEVKFLAWLEVLSVLRDLRGGPIALEKLTLWSEEVAKDNQLLDTARDCFRFVTKFFEPINVSATHIYHSALELCPISSIVRKLYHNRCHGITRLPRVVTGTSDSWDSTILFSGKDDYETCTWSPCGRFIAAQTKETIEIRNQLTFELVTILRSTRDTSKCMCPPAYSPDGQSIARGLPNSIAIWDIQTGGMAKEIECRRGIDSLAWSSDGRTIGTTLGGLENTIPGVETHDVASGAQLFAEESKLGVAYRLWAFEDTFRFMKIAPISGDSITLEISTSEIGPRLIQIESFTSIGVKFSPFSSTISPSTHRVSILDPETFSVLDIRNSNCLLHERGRFDSSQFSPDGSFFVTHLRSSFRIWKYSSGSYIPCGESFLPCSPIGNSVNLSLQFSPTLTSILFQCRNILQLWRLDDPPTSSGIDYQYAAISRSGSCIAIADDLGSTVTIIDLNSKSPSRFIDTGVEIRQLEIFGNILLVASREEVVAWLLAEEGRVEGVVNNERAGHSNSIWTVPSPSPDCRSWNLSFEGKVGVIQGDDFPPFIYHTEIGDVLDPVHKPQSLNCPLSLDSRGEKYHCIRHHNGSQHDTPPKDGWLIPHIERSEGEWVIDPEGRRRFWVPVEWRTSWDRGDWHHDITTLFSEIAVTPDVIGESIESSTIGSRRIISDGHINGVHNAMVFCFMCKNEFTGISNEPLAELVSYVASSFKELAQSKDYQHRALFDGWRAEALGMTQISAFVQFFGMTVLSPQMRVVPLTPMLPLAIPVDDDQSLQNLFLAFKAASIVIAKLRTDVKRLLNRPPLPQIPLESRQLPNVTEIKAFPVPTSQLSPTHISFKILSRYDREITYRNLYHARAASTEVKFTQQYSLDLHVFCANRDLAPKPLGSEKLTGGWFALAMEKDDTVEPRDIEFSSEELDTWKKEIRTLVNGFHKKKLVHGDLRLANFIFTKATPRKMLLVDFDWGGKVDDVFFPPGPLSPKLNVEEEEGCLRRLITVNHDNEVLERTFAELSRFSSPTAVDTDVHMAE